MKRIKHALFVGAISFALIGMAALALGCTKRLPPLADLCTESAVKGQAENLNMSQLLARAFSAGFRNGMVYEKQGEPELPDCVDAGAGIDMTACSIAVLGYAKR
jgi:hypothetical protein